MNRFPVFLYAMLMIPTTACGNAASAPEPPAPQESAPQAAEQDANESMQPEPAVGRQIQIAFGENTLVYELNDSQAAADLYDQLPLTLEIEDYSTNEKSSIRRRRLTRQTRRRRKAGRAFWPITSRGAMSSCFTMTSA